MRATPGMLPSHLFKSMCCALLLHSNRGALVLIYTKFQPGHSERIRLHRAARAPKTPVQGQLGAIWPSKTPVQGQLGASRPSKMPFQGQLGAIKPSKAPFQGQLGAIRLSKRRFKAIKTLEAAEMVQNFCKCNSTAVFQNAVVDGYRREHASMYVYIYIYIHTYT